jgi:hypothetical protein
LRSFESFFMAQNTKHILMIRPVAFEYNAETAVNNAFQQNGAGSAHTQHSALSEFNSMVQLLQKNGVHVIVVDDTTEPHTPDSIFPNNWFSTHEEGIMALYPMYAHNRRQERRADIAQLLSDQFKMQDIVDFTEAEKEEIYLEGTGSMVLDRDLRICYACISPRTHKSMLVEFCNKFGYELMAFTAVDRSGHQIYHTNVVMSVGDRFLLICMDCIPNETERSLIRQSTSKQLIEITIDQMNHFAGNILVMSNQAYGSLTPAQVTQLEKHARILHPELTTIETNGGGSARCMMAEIFLPEKAGR